MSYGINIRARFPILVSRMQKSIQKTPENSKLLPASLEQLKNVQAYTNRGATTTFTNPVTHNLNKVTVLAGANKNWDPLRLLTGKHASFDKIGAEHVQLESKVGDKIDATYVSSEGFLKFLEEKGAKKHVFEPRIQRQDVNPYNAQDVIIKTETGKEFVGLKIDFQILLNGTEIDTIEKFYSRLGFNVYQDGGNGNMYVLPSDSGVILQEEGVLEDGAIKNVTLTRKPDSVEGLVNNLEEFNKQFNGFYFEKFDDDLDKFFKKLDMVKSPWTYAKVGDGAFLVPKSDLKKVKFCHAKDPKLSNLIKIPTLPAITERGPTVLLTMNQTEVYEQYGSEFITFLLEGVNVMAYNNGGKGLSIGSADRPSIEAAIEVSYQYLHQVKRIPDNKIILKGQCFGGAPTAWLGRQHPDTNLMIDQAPSNFHEVGNNQADKFIKGKQDKAPEGSFQKKVWSSLEGSELIKGLTKGILLGFDVAEDLKHNKGHILLNIDVPNEKGIGGDELVPEHHPQAMVDKFPMKRFRKYALSMNPGGIHVSHWFSKPESYNATSNFLKKTGLRVELFRPDGVTEDAVKMERNWNDRFQVLLDESLNAMALNGMTDVSLLNLRLEDISKFSSDIEGQIKKCEIFNQEAIRFASKLRSSLRNSPDMTIAESFERFTIGPMTNTIVNVDNLIKELKEVRATLDDIVQVGGLPGMVDMLDSFQQVQTPFIIQPLPGAIVVNG